MQLLKVILRKQAFSKVDKICRGKSLSHTDFISDAIRTYIWVLGELEQGNQVLSIDKRTNNKKIIQIN